MQESGLTLLQWLAVDFNTRIKRIKLTDMAHFWTTRVLEATGENRAVSFTDVYGRPATLSLTHASAKKAAHLHDRAKSLVKAISKRLDRQEHPAADRIRMRNLRASLATANIADGAAPSATEPTFEQHDLEDLENDFDDDIDGAAAQLLSIGGLDSPSRSPVRKKRRRKKTLVCPDDTCNALLNQFQRSVHKEGCRFLSFYKKMQENNDSRRVRRDRAIQAFKLHVSFETT